MFANVVIVKGLLTGSAQDEKHQDELTRIEGGVETDARPDVASSGVERRQDDAEDEYGTRGHGVAVHGGEDEGRDDHRPRAFEIEL